MSLLAVSVDNDIPRSDEPLKSVAIVSKDKPGDTSKIPSVQEDAEAVARETLAIELEYQYDKLRDDALNAWYDVKEYLEMRGTALLNRCDFGTLMNFCETVLDMPKESDITSKQLLVSEDPEDFDAMDPY